VWNSNVDGSWNLFWRRRLFVWETELLNDLLLLLNSVTVSVEEDRWNWLGGDGDTFTVSSAYATVVEMLLPRGVISFQQESAFKLIWKCSAPSKVSGFAWLVLRDRVPTKVNLIRRQVLPNDGSQRCVFCGTCEETVEHLFLYCSFSLQVWDRVLSWLDVSFMLPHSLASLLLFLASLRGSKGKRKGLVMLWSAVVWSIWRHRNWLIFENGVVDLAGLVENIKTTSWKWWIGRSNYNTPTKISRIFSRDINKWI
jgi:hypothetical protein